MTDIQNAAAPPAGQPADSVSVTDLLNAGVHFGHQSKRWNPKMKRFIFEKRAGIYIIDLTKSLAQIEAAKQFLFDTVAGGKSVLLVGTKRQSHEIVREAAVRCGQHYVVTRWLGGTLTNYQNIANSIRHMKEIQALEQKGALDAMPQKEASRLRHELERLQRNLTGIAEMQNMPGAMIVVDINREAIAVREAKRVGIPVVALVDTNCDPDPIDYPIPANDDSTRSIKFIINVLAEAIIKAGAEYAKIRADQSAAGANQPQEQLPEAKPAETGHKPASRAVREKRRTRHGIGEKIPGRDRAGKSTGQENVKSSAETSTAAISQPEAPASP